MTPCADFIEWISYTMKMKKLLSIVLICTILLAALPLQVFATDTSYSLTITRNGVTSSDATVTKVSLKEGATFQGGKSTTTFYVVTLKANESFALINGLKDNNDKLLTLNYLYYLTNDKAPFSKSSPKLEWQDKKIEKACVEGTTLKDAKVTCFQEGYIYYCFLIDGNLTVGKDENNKNIKDPINYALLVQIEQPPKANKTQLETAISAADAIVEDNYYTIADRYNGKCLLQNGGFWSNFQDALTTAKQKEADAKATQDVVNTVTSELTTAIANLIPKTEVNATALYESWQSAKGKQSSNYSEVTWTPFEAARTAAKELLDKLYDENGDPTELNRGPNATGDAPEGAVTQKDVNAAAALLREKEAALYSASADSGNAATLGYAEKMFPALIALAEQAKQADYTPESWTAFAAALEAAKNAKAPTLTGTSTDEAAVTAYKKAFDDLYEQFYCGLTPTGEIKVSLVYTDPNDPHEYGTEAGTRGGATQTVTLDGSYSVYDAVQALANKPASAVMPGTKIFINGRYVSQNYLDQSKTEPHLGVT